MIRSCPRLVMAALRGGAGKTTLSVALIAALREQGIAVAPFKKGPDYIDAAWLARAASGPCYNLDLYLMGADGLARSFMRRASRDGVSVIEGNRGLFDGVTSAGDYSTAELAKLLGAPVILIVDCDKVSRTAAAMVLGCRHLDPALNLQGVILSRVNGARHASVIRRAIEESTGFPVLGTVPRLPESLFIQRHLGLIPPQEHDRVDEALRQARQIALDYLDVSALLQAARRAPAWSIGEFPGASRRGEAVSRAVDIGLIKDAAFQFYYPENIEALAERGANLIEISALSDHTLPSLDALYIGGGFPETHARALSENAAFRRSIQGAAREGLPIYAECGGMIYLGDTLTVGDAQYAMSGVLPLAFRWEKKPQGHGYTALAVDSENPFFQIGQKLVGHEFHYCRLVSLDYRNLRTACHVMRGEGIGNRRDGVCQNNVYGSFTHLHALGTPEWADGIIQAAVAYRRRKHEKPIGLFGDRTIFPQDKPVVMNFKDNP